MKHFYYVGEREKHNIFYRQPMEFSKHTPKKILAYALGALLYTPGTREHISKDVLSGKYLSGSYAGLTSMVLCLEDSIGDHEVKKAELNVITQLQNLARALESGVLSRSNLPLIFIRVRNTLQISALVAELGSAAYILSGFVLPKFLPENGELYFQTLQDVNDRYSQKFYGMPILESPEIIYRESRMQTLLGIKALLNQHYDSVLNVRIGGTDFSGLYGIRRNNETTIYDIAVIRDCMADILNVFGRSENEYVISGAVWEYFNGNPKILKQRIRQTPFRQGAEETGLQIRTEITNRSEEGLIREVLLDKVNGLVGKTIIHPSHIKTVQSLQVVTKEEYLDAKAIIESAESFNGVMKSSYANKMNEVKPHYNWANKILIKSNIYGVFHEQQSFINLISSKREERIFV